MTSTKACYPKEDAFEYVIWDGDNLQEVVDFVGPFSSFSVYERGGYNKGKISVTLKTPPNVTITCEIGGAIVKMANGILAMTGSLFGDLFKEGAK